MDTSILIEEEGSSLYVTEESQGVERVAWRKDSQETLHTLLARGGYKRIGKQVGSDIGGVYVKAGR